MKKKKPLIFIQDCGVWKQDVIVLVGGTKTDLLEFSKKVKARKEIIKFLTENDFFKGIRPTDLGAFCWEDEVRIAVLYLKPYQDSWEYWETLIHELNHAVHVFSIQKGFEKEMEAQAYLQEYLFHRIRRKLQGVEKI